MGGANEEIPCITRRNPSGNEPASYSQGIEVRGGGRTLYVSGQIGADEVGNVLPGIAAQSNAVFINLRAVLKEAGMTSKRSGRPYY